MHRLTHLVQMPFALATTSAVGRMFVFSRLAVRSCNTTIVNPCPHEKPQTSCWSCDRKVTCAVNFCKECNTIQPPRAADLFEYVGMETKFDVKEAELKKRFRDLQFALHPDKFAQKSDKEKALSDEHSRMLNKAFTTLSEPLRRARYLLEVLGGDVTAAEKPTDPDMLMEFFERNERVGELETSEQLREEKKLIQTEIDGLMPSLAAAFNEKNLDAIAEHIARLTYLYSLRSKVDGRIEGKLGE